MTRTQIYPVQPALQEFVRHIKIFGADFTESGDITNKYLFVPTFQRYMMFYVEDPIRVLKTGSDSYITKPAAVTIGPMEKASMLDMGRRHLAVAVAFKPGGLYRLVNMPMSEMYEQDFDTRLLLGREVEYVNEQLRESADWDEMFRVVERFLLNQLSRLRPALSIDMAIDELVRHAGNTPIEKVAADACLSLRQFERKCIEREGVPPKRQARLIRFGRAYRLKELDPLVSWTKIAHDSGYFDQMHLIRDFKLFADITPSFIDREELTSTVRLHSHIEY